jgi:hypothetical protein
MSGEALNELGRIKQSQQTALARLRAHAIALRAVGDEAGANRLALQAIALSRQNLTLATARRKLLLREPLAPQTAALKTLALQAETATARMQALIDALEQATRLVNIIGRILAVLQ